MARDAERRAGSGGSAGAAPGSSRAWLGALAAVFAGAAALEATRPLNHDLGFLLLGARRMLAGAQLYADAFVDVKPPTTLALLAPAVAAAHALGISEITALRVWFFALAAASLAICHYLVSRLLAAAPRATSRRFTLVVAFLLLVLPFRDFGQNEQVICFLLLPYLLAAALRARGEAPARSLALALGAGAGVAAALKPQYALVVAAVEASVLRERRSWRAIAGPQPAAVLLALGAALAATLWLFPDYFRVTVPLVRETYGVYQSPLRILLRAGDLGVLLVALITAFLLRRDAVLRVPAQMLFAASLAAWVAYLAGGTWYDYHRYPFRVFALVAFGSLLLTRLPRLAAVGVGGLVAFSLVVALSFATLRASGSPRASGRPLGAGAEIARAVARHGSRVIWLPASSVDPAFPAVNHAGVEWASRFSCLWPLPAVILAQVRPEAGAGAERGARLDRIRRWVMTAIVEDLERMPPDLIFVPHEPDNLAFRGYGFDFRTLFSRDPRLAEIWSRYVWVESTPSLDVYARRQPRSG